MKKRIISLLLAAVMTFSMLPTVLAEEVAEATLAADNKCGDNLTWTLSNGTLTISGTGDMTNYSSSSSVPWYSSSNSIKTVKIANGVTSIGKYAFYNCSLTSVTIPAGVTSIGNSAFYECRSLTNVTIPSSVTSIGHFAFYCCDSLTSITVDTQNQYYSSDAYGVLFNRNQTALIQYPIGNSRTSYTIPEGVTSIGSCAFLGCSSLTSVTISEGVTSIGGYAFRDCSNLTSVTIPEGVTSIGDDAFNNCSSLTSVTIPEGVTSIGSYAFYECSSLTSVTIPEGVTSIGNSAFDSCSSLTSVTIPEGVTSIGSHTFYGCINLTSVTIPAGVTSIGSYAFDGCSSLTSVTIPLSVTSIGYGAFSGCRRLTSVTIPSGVTSIGNYAFYECDSLTSVTIPASVTSIGDFAFYNCSNLTSVTIPEGVTSIGEGAFFDCDGLTSMTIPSSVTSIDDWAFDGCKSLKDVYYSGSEAQWNALKKNIGNWNYPLLNATIHFNSFGPDTGKLESLLTDSAVYSNDLAIAAAKLCVAAASGDDGKNDSVIREGLHELGFSDSNIYSDNYGKNFAYTLAKKPFAGRSNTTLISITARGSKTAYEFYKDATSFSFSHKYNGYSVYNVAYDFMEEIKEGMKQILKGESGKDLVFLVTGHSLGGAAANLYGAMLTGSYGAKNVFCYTFGAIDSIDINKPVSEDYPNIHNIYNDMDTFSPLQYGYMLLNGAGSKFGKFGHMDTFYKDYRTAEQQKDSWLTQFKGAVNHKIKNYQKAMENGTLLKSHYECCFDPNAQCASYVYSIIACPVDIDVFRNGALVGRVVKNVVDESATTIPILVIDETKYIYYPDNAQYDLKITAYEEGTMSFFTQGFRDTDNGVKQISEIPLTVGETFTTRIDEETAAENTQLLVVDEKNEVLGKVRQDGSTAELQTEAPLLNVNDAFYAGNTLRLRASCENYTGETVNANVFAAVYYDGRFVATQAADQVMIADGKEIQKEFTITCPPECSDFSKLTVELFFLDAQTSVPLGQAKIVSVNDLNELLSEES